MYCRDKRQFFLRGKGKNQEAIPEPVKYDIDGAVSLVDLPTSEVVVYGYIRANNQFINGASPIAGVSWRNQDAREDIWLKYPGYPASYVLDMMSAENQLL